MSDCPILAACLGRTKNHLKVLKLLIAHGASVDPEEGDCYSYLHKAVEVNNLGAVKVFIGAGSPINYYPPDWQELETLTPLDFCGFVQMPDWARTEEFRQQWLDDSRRITDLIVASGGFKTDLNSLLDRADKVTDLQATVDDQKRQIAELTKKVQMEKGVQRGKGGKGGKGK